MKLDFRKKNSQWTCLSYSASMSFLDITLIFSFHSRYTSLNCENWFNCLGEKSLKYLSIISIGYEAFSILKKWKSNNKKTSKYPKAKKMGRDLFHPIFSWIWKIQSPEQKILSPMPPKPSASRSLIMQRPSAGTKGSEKSCKVPRGTCVYLCNIFL